MCKFKKSIYKPLDNGILILIILLFPLDLRKILLTSVYMSRSVGASLHFLFFILMKSCLQLIILVYYMRSIISL
jgi:hypothetical protein